MRGNTHTHTHTHTQLHFNFFSFISPLWGVLWRALKQQRWWMSGCPLSLFCSTPLNGPFKRPGEIDGGSKFPPKKKKKKHPSFFSLLLFFLRLATARRLINTRYFTRSKTSHKDLFLFTSRRWSELTELGAEGGLEGNQCNQSLPFSLTYSSLSFVFPRLTDFSQVRPNMWFPLTAAPEQLIAQKSPRRPGGSGGRRSHDCLFYLLSIESVYFWGEV